MASLRRKELNQILKREKTRIGEFLLSFDTWKTMLDKYADFLLIKKV